MHHSLFKLGMMLWLGVLHFAYQIQARQLSSSCFTTWFIFRYSDCNQYFPSLFSQHLCIIATSKLVIVSWLGILHVTYHIQVSQLSTSCFTTSFILKLWVWLLLWTRVALPNSLTHSMKVDQDQNAYYVLSHLDWHSLLRKYFSLTKRVPHGSVVRCMTRNPGVLGSSLTRSYGFFRGSVLGQDTSEPSLVLVKPRKAWIMWPVAMIWLKYC